jgi:N-acetylglucosaminyldiphosphoundecaprenol N-acetyl-beta-D-mannosaminyltransferase
VTLCAKQLPLDSFECCGVRIAATNLDDATNAIVSHAARSDSLCVHLCNAYTLSLATQDRQFGQLLNHAALNLPDGTPVAWFGALLDRRRGRHPVPGPVLMSEVFERARNRPVKHFLLGGSPEGLARLKGALEQRFPHADIVGTHAPPFTTDITALTDESVTAIAGSGANVVWIGLGTPKQDWVADRLTTAAHVVAVPVGAAFDFISGDKPEAPAWLRGTGLEWLFRLSTEPRRLWRRYLVSGPVFLWGAAHSLREHRAEGARTLPRPTVPGRRRLAARTPRPGRRAPGPSRQS